VQVFIRGNPFRGSATAGDLLFTWIDRLLAANLLRGVVIYGSPYGLVELRDRLPPGLPYGFTYGQMEIAQQLLLNRLGLGLQPPARPVARAFTD
jgi:beta-glucosidase